MLKNIRNLLIFIVIFGVLTAFFDYSRMNSGIVPIFNISKYDKKTKIQSYRGLFYQASRHVKVSTSESLVDSSDIEFTVLNQKINVPKQYKELSRDFTIKVEDTPNCTEQSKLYYADLNIKVYTYCINKIDITENNKTNSLFNYLKKDKKILNNIDYKLAYTGISSDNSTLMYTDLYNLSDKGISMYRCNKTNINDVYITPKDTPMQSDFCTYKDDDFKYIFSVKEEPSTTDNTTTGPEVFYEDDEYTYEFDKPTLDRITITTPAVRGKEATSTPLRQILENKTLTIDELHQAGLKFNMVKKK